MQRNVEKTRSAPFCGLATIKHLSTTVAAVAAKFCSASKPGQVSPAAHPHPVMNCVSAGGVSKIDLERCSVPTSRGTSALKEDMPAKRMTPEEHLESLKADSDTLLGDDLRVCLESALKSKSNLVVEFAAKLVVTRESRVSTEPLVAAYAFFAEDGLSRDRNCRAKTPIVEALAWLEYDDSDFYLAGIQYRQIEPAWGEPVDTAVNIRGASAYGLIRCRSASPAATMIALVDLLADKEALARVHAAHAIGASGSPAAVPVLRLKARSGDTNFEVLGECMKGLLSNDLASGIDFVASYLTRGEDLAIEAATALGATHDERAIRQVISASKVCDEDRLEAFLVSISLSRLPVAIEYLIDAIREDSIRALPALKALAPNRFYPDIRRQVESAVADGGNSQVHESFEDLFEVS